MLGFDDNGSNSAQESSPNEESNDSSHLFSADKQITSTKKQKTKVKNVVFHVHMAPERHLNKVKWFTRQTQN